jgi:flagellin-like hook-associated protein FlgL
MRINTLNSSNHLEVSRQNVRASDSQMTGAEMSPAMARFTENQIRLHADDATDPRAKTPQTILDLLQ